MHKVETARLIYFWHLIIYNYYSGGEITQSCVIVEFNKQKIIRVWNAQG